MPQRISRSLLPWWRGLLLAFGATGLAWLARAALDPVLTDQMPYILFVPGVMAVSIFAGRRLGMLTAILGGLAANLSFVPHAGRFTFEGSYGWSFGAFIMVSLLLVALVSTLATALRQEMQLRETLVTVSREYRHRIKNLFAISQSLVSQTARSAGSIPEFKNKVLNRLHALSRAQDLLQAGEAQAVPLRGLIDDILGPFRLEGRLARPIRGPSVLVSADITVALALLLNELATNAMKHGALSVQQGRLKLGWTVDGDWTLIEWKEVAGPKVTAPEQRGFGSRLFESALPSESGSAELIFEPDGLRCQIKLRNPSQ